MKFTKVGKKIVKKFFKLNVEIFHQRQPNCKLDLYERATKKEIQIHPEIEDGIDLRRCPLSCHRSLVNKQN